MSFLYPRTIAITRPVETTTGSGIGEQPYSAPQESTETPIVSGLPASIQSVRERGRPLGETPSDAEAKSQWNINIPLGAVTVGTIRDCDIATDDLGRRFMITAADPTAMGYRLRCELAEA